MPRSSHPQWAMIWGLWTRYFSLGPLTHLSVYESAKASQVHSAKNPRT
ncbi:hypothetical protein [Saccharothrix hoggarensis]|uniref:Uncharacterized protein n=1 Tax=Saccharothrix hoggarensis TaxID=913853 RepID=A0ABW3QL92_9PSEU